MNTLKTVRAPEMNDTIPPGHVRVAAVQMNVALGRVEDNTAVCVRHMEQGAQAGAQLLLFPECALTGYAFPTAQEADRLAVHGDVPLTPLVDACRRLQVSVIVGYLESKKGVLLNAATMVSPQGIGPRYYKTHLPHLGADRWVCAGGEPLTPHELQGLRTGVLICYDGSFPEACRTLALRGAELIALPTNWPAQAAHKAEWLPNTRAYENVVYFAAVNRVGEESGFTFPGLSRICSPKGMTLAQGPAGEEALLLADVDPREARQKKIQRGEDYWVDRIADRRPKLYDLGNAAE